MRKKEVSSESIFTRLDSHPDLESASLVELCSYLGLRMGEVQYWLKRYREKGPCVPRETGGFVELRSEVGRSDAQGLEIRYPDGVEVHYRGDISAELLRSLIPQLNRQ